MPGEFEPVDFVMQSPCTLVELLDAAGVDGGVPDHRMDNAGPGRDESPGEPRAD